MPQYKERQAYRRARKTVGLGRVGTGHKGASRSFEPCAHASQTFHSGIRARINRGQSY